MAVLGNTPTITHSAYAGSIYDGMGTAMGGTATALGLVSTSNTSGISPMRIARSPEFIGDCSSDHFEEQQHRKYSTLISAALAEKYQGNQMAKSTMRMVQVFIADPNDNVPLDDRMIYRGNQHLTDATDQELFFEINIVELLAAHNAKRVKVVDKSVKDRVEYLEPVKIRDLRMVVVNVATF